MERTGRRDGRTNPSGSNQRIDQKSGDRGTTAQLGHSSKGHRTEETGTRRNVRDRSPTQGSRQPHASYELLDAPTISRQPLTEQIVYIFFTRLAEQVSRSRQVSAGNAVSAVPTSWNLIHQADTRDFRKHWKKEKGRCGEPSELRSLQAKKHGKP